MLYKLYLLLAKRYDPAAKVYAEIASKYAKEAVLNNKYYLQYYDMYNKASAEVYALQQALAESVKEPKA